MTQDSESSSTTSEDEMYSKISNGDISDDWDASAQLLYLHIIHYIFIVYHFPFFLIHFFLKSGIYKSDEIQDTSMS